MSEFTLGGYREVHERAPAFTGSDGRAYSVAIWVDDARDERGRIAGALLFVRWRPDGSEPDGHLETDWLVKGDNPVDVEERLGSYSLHDVKDLLEECIATAPGEQR